MAYIQTGDLPFKSFCDGADLIDLQQQRIASFRFNGSLDALDVGCQEVVAHQLDLAACVEFRPVVPIVLAERILQ